MQIYWFTCGAIHIYMAMAWVCTGNWVCMVPGGAVVAVRNQLSSFMINIIMVICGL